MPLKERLERKAQVGEPAPQDAAPGIPERRERAAARPQSGEVTPDVAFAATKAAIHARLVEALASEVGIVDRETMRSRIASLSEEYMREMGLGLNRLDYGRLIDALLDEMLGLGPLQALIDDPEITEVMVNQPRQVYVERGGRVSLSPVMFESTDQLRKVIDRIVSGIGRRVDESSPMCDARLSDGSRVNVVLPPVALDGPCLTVRKFSHETIGSTNLVEMRAATEQMMRFLEASVRARLSILISGGTSSGKTTLLNILSGYIPASERIVTIEDAAELKLRQTHVIRLESRPPNMEGIGVITIRDLVRNALRMRPDRIIVGECRGAETLDMLQAMNTGHEGSMSTIHANGVHDAISRLETMVLMAGTDLPARAIQKQIASAIDVIVQLERVQGGARKIVSIAEVTGLSAGDTQVENLFEFRQTGVDADGNAQGYHTATGVRPIRAHRFVERGERLPDDLFEPADTALEVS